MAQAAKRSEATAPAFSGRLLLRMPPELHAEVAEQAERSRVSLNQFITTAVATAVGWGDEGNDGAEPADAARASTSRAIKRALVLNLVVLTAAAGAAIALVVLSWMRL
jgi:hypothetical protein